MDLIYTNASREDVGVLHDYTLDLAIGADENDFELVVATDHHCCGPNCLAYIEGTEYGGIIDGMSVATKDDKLTYRGRTWHGILASKILEPDTGEDYLVVSGEANAAIGTLLERASLSDIFTAASEDSGLIIDGYAMNRYIDAYAGIVKMLGEVGGKLLFSFQNGMVTLKAAPIADYSQTEEFDSDLVEMTVERIYNPVNHMVCLGKGELADRQVVHLYSDAAGNAGVTQFFFGLEEIADVYENTNAESLEELTRGGTERLREQAAEGKARLDITADSVTYDIGDIVGARENITGTLIREKITKKIVTINRGTINIEYKVGE